MSSEHKNSVKRNLKESFANLSDESIDSPLLNYSLVDQNKSSDEPLKLKLRVSKTPNICVLMKRIPEDVMESYLSKNETAVNVTPQKSTRRISFAASPKSNLGTPVRRSGRVTERKSYAELISPEKFLRGRRGRTKSVDCISSLYCASPSTPRSERAKRNVRPPVKYSPDENRRYSETIKLSVLAEKLKTRTSKNFIEESSDEEKVPQKLISTPSSSSKSTSARTKKLIREGIITPSVQRRARLLEYNGTPLMKARAQLHVSYVPDALPCREKEYMDVLNFLEGKLQDGCGGCMYISGVPGTGKTATVTAVINKLQKKMQQKRVPKFEYVNINGMRLTEPRQSYVEILRQLSGKTVLWEQAQSILDTKFSKSKKATLPVILLVDELYHERFFRYGWHPFLIGHPLDILCTKRQDVVYNLLDWPTKVNAQLIVVTIANTMDLPERLLLGRVTSRLGLTRLTFQPYSYKQLQEIVTKRLLGVDTFNPDAVQLVARKVASVSGDARRALDICRRAAEIADARDGSCTLVSLKHVNAALNAMITQPKVQAIKHCSRLEQLIMKSVVAEVERTGVEETSFSDVYTMLVAIAALDGFRMVSVTVALGAVQRLSACRLLLTDQKCSDIYQKIILNVSSDDVYFALKKD